MGRKVLINGVTSQAYRSCHLPFSNSCKLQWVISQSFINRFGSGLKFWYQGYAPCTLVHFPELWPGFQKRCHIFNESYGCWNDKTRHSDGACRAEVNGENRKSLSLFVPELWFFEVSLPCKSERTFDISVCRLPRYWRKTETCSAYVWPINYRPLCIDSAYMRWKW
jgi:hypothetical protein